MTSYQKVCGSDAVLSSVESRTCCPPSDTCLAFDGLFPRKLLPYHNVYLEKRHQIRKHGVEKYHLRPSYRIP